MSNPCAHVAVFPSTKVPSLLPICLFAENLHNFMAWDLYSFAKCDFQSELILKALGPGSKKLSLTQTHLNTDINVISIGNQTENATGKMWCYKSDLLQNPVAKTYIKRGRGILKNWLYLLKISQCSFRLATNESLLYCTVFLFLRSHTSEDEANSRKFSFVMSVFVVETYSCLPFTLS